MLETGRQVTGFSGTEVTSARLVIVEVPLPYRATQPP